MKKSKDGDDGYSFNPVTHVVDVGIDAYGEPRTTLVIDHGLEVISYRKLASTPNHLRMLELFSRMRTCGEGPVLISEFKKEWKTVHGATKASRARQVKGWDFMDRCRLVPVDEEVIDYANQRSF